MAVQGVNLASEPIFRSLREVQRACDGARAELQRLTDALEVAAHDAEPADCVLFGVVQEARLKTALAIQSFEHELMRLRGAAVRTLVDGRSVTLSEVAARMGVSRTMVTRLYRSPDA